MQTEKIIDHIVNWLRDYATGAGMKGFVVGVSGGIDSALTSTLCARTGLEVLCLEMPIHQSKKQVTRAANHIYWLKQNHDNVQSEWIDLTPVFDNLIEALPPPGEEEALYMSLANTRARLRMTSLYYFAALKKYLVAGTGTILVGAGAAYYTNRYGTGFVVAATAGILGAHASIGGQLALGRDWFLGGGVGYGSYFLQHQGALPYLSVEHHF